MGEREGREGRPQRCRNLGHMEKDRQRVSRGDCLIRSYKYLLTGSCLPDIVQNQ